MAVGIELRVNGGAPIDVGNVSIYNITGLFGDVDVNVEIRRYAGNYYTDWSPVVTAHTPLAGPTGLRGTVLGLTQILVEWDRDPSGTVSYDDTGLEPDTEYFYKVKSVSDLGVHSAFSAPISVITSPTDLVPTDLVDITESPAGTWAKSGGADWQGYAKCQQKLPTGANGFIRLLPSSTGTIAFGFMDSDDVGDFTTIDYGMFASGNFFWLDAGTPSDSGVGFANGDEFLIKRIAGTLSAYRVRSGVETLIHTFSGTHNADLFIKFVIYQNGHSFTNPVGLGVVDK